MRIKTEETGRWNISFNPIRKLDAGELSDAPESRWLIQPDERWTKIQLDSEITGSLHSSDNIDIYLIRILDQNGSRVYLNQLIKSEPQDDLIKKAAQSQLKVMEWEKENANAL